MTVAGKKLQDVRGLWRFQVEEQMDFTQARLQGYNSESKRMGEKCKERVEVFCQNGSVYC